MAETTERAFARLGCRGEEQSRAVEGDNGFVQTGDKEKEKGRTRFCRILREFAACGLVFAEIIMYNKRQRSHFGRWPE